MSYFTIIPATASVTCLIGMPGCGYDITTISGKEAVKVLTDENHCVGHTDIVRALSYNGCEVVALMGEEGVNDHVIIRALATSMPIDLDKIIEDCELSIDIREDDGWHRGTMAKQIADFEEDVTPF